jgi:hypothetical protein
MTQQYFITREDLQNHYKVDSSVYSILQEIRKELLSEHKILTRIFVDEGSFENEESVEKSKSLSQVARLGFEYISVRDIVSDICTEWIEILEDLNNRSFKVGESSQELDLLWASRETKNIETTFADLVESYLGLKEYFGDTLLAPFIQIDGVEISMNQFVINLRESLAQEETKKWFALYQGEFVKLIEVWQTFFNGVFRVFN